MLEGLPVEAQPDHTEEAAWTLITVTMRNLGALVGANRHRQLAWWDEAPTRGRDQWRSISDPLELLLGERMRQHAEKAVAGS